MEAIELLKAYQKRIQPYLEEFFKEKLQQAKEIDPLAEEAVAIIRDFTLSGGKRVRPALMYYGYLAAGGDDREKMVKTSMSIEMTHTFLLIHDDIIDKDELRHGTKTVHERYKDIAKKMFPKTDIAHFGNSMAMIAGDMAASMGSEIIFNANYDPAFIVKALDKLQRIVYVTIPGEMVDVVLEAKGEATEKDIMRMYEGKTARYTFEGPLHLGGVLAGADEEILKNFTNYAIPLGNAFQIRDDILGVFGEQKKLGKPVGSDIIEGKQTLLVVKTLELGSKSQKETIKKLLGKEDITKSEIEEFRRAIEESGALDYAYDVSKKLVEEALSALTDADIRDDEARTFFEGIAQFIIERQH